MLVFKRSQLSFLLAHQYLELCARCLSISKFTISGETSIHHHIVGAASLLDFHFGLWLVMPHPFH